ncbi:cupin domain-containing protein [Pedobacter lithocola]|uniref:Cupin domain-containing protein n=1 Tax=Pedobacter lithocola TaxID=1908239 RepID=A0ABV8PF24_9SPHI
MERRKFLLGAAATIPLFAFGSKSDVQQLRSGKSFIVKNGESRFKERTLLSGKNPNDVKISSKDTGGQLTVFEYTGNEKGGPPLHIHPHQDEIFFIMQGEYLFQVGNENYLLKAGDTIFLPRNIPHTFAQSTEKGKCFCFFQPSGKMEDFFRVLGSLKGELSPEQGAKIFINHDMKVVGPPLKF